MNTTAAALQGLHQALDAPRTQGVALGNWRWVVRQRMAAVRDVLVNEPAFAVDGWLAAREGSVLRERNALLGRLSVLGPQVLESPDAEAVRGELKRLLHDVGHYLQRRHDLAYDDVEIELGGSE
ncbi:MAG: hypothetical protein ACK4UY_16150 [Dietzia sp.]